MGTLACNAGNCHRSFAEVLGEISIANVSGVLNAHGSLLFDQCFRMLAATLAADGIQW